MGSYFVGEVGDHCMVFQEVLGGLVGLGVHIASIYLDLKTATEMKEMYFCVYI